MTTRERRKRNLHGGNASLAGAAVETELRESFELAEDQLAAEKLSGNIVKEHYWRGELAALHRIRRVIEPPNHPSTTPD